MQFVFDPKQEYQVRAIESVSDLLDGQPVAPAGLAFVQDIGFAALPNRLDIDDEELLGNLQDVQKANDIEPDPRLMWIEGTIEAKGGGSLARFANFSIEMETGTGKTYVYIRTILELSKLYGLRKFIIVVPSVAIREGVLKTLEVTRGHFAQLYHNLPYRYYVYESSNLSIVRQFALSDSLEIMIMTIDSFNKASNVIRQRTDRLQGITPIHLVQTTRPILILDEPQNMESELRVKALADLNPLFALRYSATHRNPYNLVYRLLPLDAYRQGLVKRIEIASVVAEEDLGHPFVRLDSIKTEGNVVSARITVHKLMKSGTIKEQTVAVRPGSSLRSLSNRPDYNGYEIDEISPGGRFIRFSNNLELREGESLGLDKQALFAAQIKYTIQEHFRKQDRMKDTGIKVLSLFFIDHVDNYASSTGVIRVLFRDAFNELKSSYPDWRTLDPESVQGAYFAKKRKGGQEEWADSFSGESKEDEAAYDLIMKNKERLLSFDEPVSFIFSHSALREGWDNPNIFQICTLNQTTSEIKKRQEVGRGMRLAVDQNGVRVMDERVNVLTVVANESYQKYVEKLQAEIEEEYGAGGAPPKPANARRRREAKLRKHHVLKPEFKELWERIKHKTSYAVRLDTEQLITAALAEINRIEIPSPVISATKAQIRVDSTDALHAVQVSPRTVMGHPTSREIPNLLEIATNVLENTSPPVRLTRASLLEIFRRVENKEAALKNLQYFALTVARVVKTTLSNHLVDGIKYEKINDWYEMTQLEGEFEGWSDHLIPAERSLYDFVPYESEVERQFVEDLESREDVKLYFKLPPWFTVPTPIGQYNPDWAIVFEQLTDRVEINRRPLLYLVCETKGQHWQSSLRPEERQKIECGREHFQGALNVPYKVATRAGELP